MPFSQRLFQLFLLAYPREFRREYGFQMAQLFRDCYRDESGTGSPLRVMRLWLRTFFDLIKTAPGEHLANLTKENSTMNNYVRQATALLGVLGIIVIAFLLLGYGRRNEVSAILPVGAILDAIVTTGIIGNFVVFLLVKTTRFNPVKVALWTFAIVNGALLLVALVLGSRVDPQFALGKIVLAYVASFLFWFGLHWLWTQGKTALPSTR